MLKKGVSFLGPKMAIFRVPVFYLKKEVFFLIKIECPHQQRETFGTLKKRVKMGRFGVFLTQK